MRDAEGKDDVIEILKAQVKEHEGEIAKWQEEIGDS